MEFPRKFRCEKATRNCPISPYGTSKLLVEQILRDLDAYQGLRSVVLRYFNAAGADIKGRIGEWHNPESHVIPIAIDVARGKRSLFKIYGSDYSTPDGTCIRDFVHVADLADAHARSVDYLMAGGTSIALNLGTGKGTSIKQLVQTSRENISCSHSGRNDCEARIRQFFLIWPQWHFALKAIEDAIFLDVGNKLV